MGTPLEHMGTSGAWMRYFRPCSIALKFNWCHFVHFVMRFRKYDFQNAASTTLMILFQPNLLQVFPMTVHTKVISWTFRHFKI